MIDPVCHVLAWSVGTMSDVSLFEVGLIAGGGAIGAVSRYLIGTGLARTTSWPGWAGVLIVNLLGCLMIGLAAGSGDAGPWTHAFLMTGVCGALTTMSGLALDLTVLIWIAAWRQFAWCLGLTLAGGIPLVLIGRAIGEMLWEGVA